MGGRLGGQKLHWQSPKRWKFKSTLSLKSGAKISKIIHVSISLCRRTWMDNWYDYFHHSWIYIFLDRVYIAAFNLLPSLFMELFGLKHYVEVYHYTRNKEFYPEINCLQTIIFHSSPGFLAARVKHKKTNDQNWRNPTSTLWAFLVPPRAAISVFENKEHWS